MADFLTLGNDFMVRDKDNTEGWTFDTLKMYLDHRFDALEDSIHKTEQHIDDRFAGVNEFRRALNDLTATMLPRNEYTVNHQALSDRIVLNDRRIENLNLQMAEVIAKQTAERQGLGVIGSIIAGLVATAGVVVAVLTFFLKH